MIIETTFYLILTHVCIPDDLADDESMCDSASLSAEQSQSKYMYFGLIQ